MARYKVLKSVAHSLAHSFVSVMNYHRDDYVMCHLLRRAEATRRLELRVDVLRELAGPMDLLSRPVLECVRSYCRDFGRLVVSSGSALDMVAEAELSVRCTLGRRGVHQRNGNGHVRATARLVDDRGRIYLARALETYDYIAPR
jgi:hypothetical protein